MRHLERHQKNSLTNNLKLITLILVLLIIFIFTYGFKLLLGTASFVSQLSNKNQPNDQVSSKENFFGTIDITDIPTATNSSAINISASVTNYNIVEIFLNDQKVDTVDVIDTFNKEITNLKQGDNEVYLLAKSTTNKSTEKTITYNVIYKKDKPRLEINQPTDGFKSSHEEITVSGKTDNEIIIEINSLPVVVNVSGEFQSTIKLQPGENKIEISASDVAGNIETRTITVFYEKD